MNNELPTMTAYELYKMLKDKYELYKMLKDEFENRGTEKNSKLIFVDKDNKRHEIKKITLCLQWNS